MLTKLGFIVILFIPMATFAAEDRQPKGQITKPHGLSLGIGAVGSNGIYVGEKN
jgi:outer membrane protein